MEVPVICPCHLSLSFVPVICPCLNASPLHLTRDAGQVAYFARYETFQTLQKKVTSQFTVHISGIGLFQSFVFNI